MCSEEATDEVADALKSGAPEANSNTQSTTADPVNLVTGAFVLTETDVKIPVGRLMLEFTRHYDSSQHKATGDSGPIGRGWTHSYHLFLTLDDPKHPVYHDDRMTRIRFEADKERENTFIPIGRCGVELYRRKEGFHLRQGDGLRAEFTDGGMLTRIVRPGPKLDVTIELEYDTRRRLQRVRGLGGRELRFRYEGESPLICQLSDHTGRGWHFAYVRDELACITRPDHALCEYEYARSDMHVATARKQTAKKTVCGMVKVFLPRLADDEKVAMATNRYTSEGRVYEQLDAFGHVTAFDYNLYTRTTCVTDPAGWTTVYCFDEAGNTTKMRKPGGGTREWLFDEKRNLVAETKWIDETTPAITEYVDFAGDDILRRMNQFGTRALGNRSPYIRPSSLDIAIGYDRYGNRPLVRDSLGNATRLEYITEFGISLQTTLPDGSAVTRRCDPRSGLVVLTERLLTIGREEPLNHFSRWRYDDWGNEVRFEEWTETVIGNANAKRVRETEYDFETHQPVAEFVWIEAPGTNGHDAPKKRLMSYDNLGRIVRLTRSRSESSNRESAESSFVFEYDILGRLVGETDPAGVSKRTVFSTAGNPVRRFTSTIAKLGQMDNQSVSAGLECYEWQYDAAGRRILERDPSGAATTWHYDECGHCVQKTYPLGCVTRSKFDRSGARILCTLPSGLETKTERDWGGRQLRITDNSGRDIGLKYDLLGHVVKRMVNGTDEQATSFDWDWKGRLSAVHRPGGVSERFDYDEYDNVGQRAVLLLDGTVVAKESREYDGLGRLTAILNGTDDNRLCQFRFAYDDVNLRVRTRDAIGNETQSVFDSEGNRIVWQDAEGRTLRDELDGNNRIVRRWSDDNLVDCTFCYDHAGRLIDAAEGEVRYSFDFDNCGRLIRHQQTLGAAQHVIAYRYDRGGRLVDTQIDDSHSVRYLYASGSPLISAVQFDQYSFELTYDHTGRLITERRNDGESIHYMHSSWGSLQAVRQTNAVGKVYREQWIDRDALGHPVSLRLNGSEFDAAVQFTYDRLYRLVAVTDPTSNQEHRRYVFDDRGNRTHEYRNGVLHLRCEYDDANRPLRVHRADGHTVEFTHDRCGNRTSDGERSYSYDGLGRLRSVAFSFGDPLQFEYAATGERVLSRRGWSTAVHLFDGSVRVIDRLSTSSTMWLWSVPLNRLFGTAADGKELCHLVDTGLQMKSSDIRVPFDPFGADQEHDASPVGSFQGSPFDSDLEWYDHRARFLDPELGRFTTPDPLGPVDSSNLYTFANNNPLSFRDASGYLATQAPHSISAPLALPAPAMHQHHTMPAFRGDKNAEKQAFFTSRNINVHNYTVNISRLMHLSCVHGRGFFPGASNPESVGRFNDVWDRFMSSNPDAPREAVGVFAEYLGNHYGYGDLTVGPYASGADSNAQSFHFGELSDHIGADHSKSDVIYL